MTPPKPADEAVEAAVDYAATHREPRETKEQTCRILRNHSHLIPHLDEWYYDGLMQISARILAAALHHERCELGHTNDLLDQIKALCDGHGVGLRDAVQDVLAGR